MIDIVIMVILNMLGCVVFVILVLLARAIHTSHICVLILEIDLDTAVFRIICTTHILRTGTTIDYY